METPKLWYIWSNEHDSWWKPNSFGYTHKKSEAGKYTLDQALTILKTANRYLLDEAIPAETIVPVV